MSVTSRERERQGRAEIEFRIACDLERMGHLDQAIDAYIRVLTIVPDHTQAHLNLASVYSKKSNMPKAEQHRALAEHRPELPIPVPLMDVQPQKKRRTFVPLEDKPKGICSLPDKQPSILSGHLDPPSVEKIDPDGDARVLALLPMTAVTFYGRFGSLHEIQRLAAPMILNGGNAMVLSSTASGKTEAVFAPLIERMLSEKWKGLSILYVSPTKALVGDIRQRLEETLRPLGVKVAQRDGDIKDLNEHDPEQILVTTPESLDSMLCWKGAQLKNIKAVVLDELHMLDGTYRGDQLMVLLRRLRLEQSIDPSIYAMSATVGEPERMASKYMRSPTIIKAGGGRGIDYHIVPELDNALFWIKQLKAKKVLIFCNTPWEAEDVINTKCRWHFPPEALRVHHGKLERDRREEAEMALRKNDHVICACTSTLEVGVDIGDIDLVVLYDLPRSISSLAQRIGRANRRGDIIKVIAVGKGGTMTYYEKVFKAVIESKFETSKNDLDPSVGIQQIFSTITNGGKDLIFISEMLKGLIESSDIDNITSHLISTGHIVEREGKLYPGKPCIDFGPRIYSNIPRSESILVVERGTGMPIGRIDMPLDNIFVLSGQAWAVAERLEEKVLVDRIDRSTTIAKFTSYDRHGSFFDLLPASMKLILQRKEHMKNA